MFDATWSPVISLSAASFLLCLAATGIVAWVLLRRLENLRRVTQERLEELNGRLRLLEPRQIDKGADARNARSARPSPPAPLSSGRHADQEPAQASPTLIAIPDLAERDRPEDPQIETDLSQRHAEIWALAATGTPPEEIARQTGQPIGQVELIVGLYRQLRSSKGPLDHAPSV